MRAIVLLLVLLLAGCIAGNDESPPDSLASASPVQLDANGLAAPISTGWTYQELTFASDMAEFPVHMEVYLPDPKTALNGSLPNTYPTLLMASPYWDDGVGPDLKFNGYVAYEGLTQRMIQRGYAIVLGDSASMGGSGGCWDFMGPNDVAGVLALVDAITQQPWSNGKVGMHGLSYDGMTQVMAASHAAPGLVTVVPAAPLTHAYAGLYQGGVHYGTGWHGTTAGYTSSALTPRLNEERQEGWANSVASSPECADTNAMANDPTGDYNAYFHARDFRPRAEDVTASVFVLQGWFDAAVKPDNFGQWFADIPTEKKAWLGWWPHTYPSADVSGREDLILTLQRWFDHELLGIPNGIMDEPMIDVMDSQGRWRHEDTWPPMDAQPWDLSLSQDGSMKSNGTTPGSVTVNPPTDVPLLLVGYEGTRFQWLAHEDTRIVGAPTLHVRVASDRAGGYLIARLLDMSGSEDQLVSRGAINLMHRGEGVTPTMPGVPIEIDLNLYPTDYLLPAGHNLVLELKVQDDTLWYDTDAQNAILTVSTGDQVSMLQMQTLKRSDAPFLVACGPYLQKYVTDCYDDTREDQGV